MTPQGPTGNRAAAASAQTLLTSLADLARRVMGGAEAAEMVLSGLESLAGIVAYDHAMLEIIPGFGQAGTPTVFRATPAAIEAVSPSAILADADVRMFPLTAEGRLVGRLRVAARDDGGFTPGELAALHVLAALLSQALRIAELETTSRRLADLEALQRRQSTHSRTEMGGVRRQRAGGLKAELSQLLSAQLGLSVLCDRVLERLIAVLEVDAGAMFIYDEREGELMRATQRGVPGPLPARMVIDAGAPALLGRTVAEGAPRRVVDAWEAPLQSEADTLLRTWGFRSVLCYPLLSGKRIIGGMQLMSRQAGAITDEGMALLDALRDELALALQNAVTFDRLSTMTVTDGLTGLHNRRFCEEFVRKQVMGAQRTRRGCGILLIDIDHFSSFNEQFGRPAGDAVLRRVAAVLLRSIRAADLAGRYDGGAFMVVLPHADLSTAVTVAERIRANVSEMPVDADGAPDITVSIGAASFPENAASLAQLFNCADVALYAAKEGGRNRIEAAPRPATPAR